ncbi:MAG: pyridoxal-phosphate dependent enzyme [Myxococcales bacterium]|nr:pyridoxal-phosphate dependent enzyme [Myxococcales bacterium]
MQEEVLSRSAGAELDQLFVPVGGGGLIAGACLAFEGSSTEIISVEPEGCCSMQASLAAGRVTAVEPGPTLADGLKPTRVGELNFAIAKERVSRAITVSDQEIGRAMVKLLLTTKTLVEPSGAAALAGAMREATKGARVGVILSGGNIAPATLSTLLATYG